MQFKADENVPAEAIKSLRAAGHDVETVLDEGLGGRSDGEVMDACLLERRCLVTLDLDFADIRAYPPGDHPGIAVLRLPSHDSGTVLLAIERLLRTLGGEELRGHLWIVEPDQVRIRAE